MFLERRIFGAAEYLSFYLHGHPISKVFHKKDGSIHADDEKGSKDDYSAEKKFSMSYWITFPSAAEGTSTNPVGYAVLNLDMTPGRILVTSPPAPSVKQRIALWKPSGCRRELHSECIRPSGQHIF